MARVNRSEMDMRRIGFPPVTERLDAIEAALLSLVPDGPAKDRLQSLVDYMDQLDIQHPTDLSRRPN